MSHLQGGEESGAGDGGRREADGRDAQLARRLQRRQRSAAAEQQEQATPPPAVLSACGERVTGSGAGTIYGAQTRPCKCHHSDEAAT